MAKIKAVKVQKVKEKEDWVPFAYEVYQKAINNLVHLSVKAVNSNADAGGIRLSEKVNLPYIAVSTVKIERVGLDYTKNAGKIASVVKQINAVMDGTYMNRFHIVPEQEIEWIKTLYATLGYANITDEVDCHIKQVLMHNGEEDVSLSPLHSAGLAALLNSAEADLLMIKNAEIIANNLLLLASKRVTEKTRLVRRIEMNYGGANPQNVGSLTRAMQHPFFYMPPKENPESSRVFSLHYKGLKIENNVLIDELLVLTDAHHKKLAEGMPSLMEDRSAIENQLVKIVQEAKACAAEAVALLKNNKDLLPVDDNEEPELFSEGVLSNKLQAGFLIEDLRSAAWRKEFSRYLVQKISNRKRRIRTEQGESVEIGTGIGSGEGEVFRSIIENEVRK